MTAEEILRQVYTDKELLSIRQKIEAGTATFTDTAMYSERVSGLIGSTLSTLIPELPAGSREQLCTALLHGQYEDTNKLLADVQRASDEAQGLHLAPQKAPFPAERVQQVAQSLEDMTVPEETIQRRANAPVANVSKSFHDAYMKENAKFRSKAGLKCFITRNSSSGCCQWCSEVSGKYEFKDAPDDIFRRHDNCDCTVIYDNQVLRGKYADDGEHRTKTWEQVGELPTGFEPTLFSQEQAAELQAKNLQFKGLTSDTNPAIMKNIELPTETSKIRSMSSETKKLISSAFDNVFAEYDVQVVEIVTESLKPEEKNVPFQFQPVRGKDGELIKRIVINSDYDFMGSQEAFQERIMRNFNRGVLASNSVEGLISHELAHVMTFQDVVTFTGYLLENKSVSERFVHGVSLYADATGDGAECIAEAFAALRCGQSISDEAQALVTEFIERWRKNGT